MRPRPLRSLPHRLSPRRRRPHGAVQLALRPPRTAAPSCCASRTPTPSVRRTRWCGRSSRACAGWASTGTKAPRSAARTVRTRRRRGSTAIASEPTRWSATATPTTAIARTERLQAERAAAEARGEGWIYDRQCLRLSADEIASMEAAQLPRAVRVRVPEGETTFDDQVHGPITIDHATIEDFVIVRSDGLPTYQLSVVCDDIDMAITHVIRGDDHISNTPKQILLYRALGAAVPGLRARAAHPRPRQEAPEQAARRDVGRRVRGAGHPAGSVRELPGAARLVARQRRGDLHARRADRALLARRHQRRQRRVQPREARVVQRAAPGAAVARRLDGARAAGSSRRPGCGTTTLAGEPTGVVRSACWRCWCRARSGWATSRRSSCRFSGRSTATTRPPSTST